MRHVLSAFLLAFTPVMVLAQDQAGGPILSLEEAIDISIRNNPQHLQQLSSRSRSGTALRSAYGALLPSVSSSMSFGFRAGGQTFFAGQTIGASSDVRSSSYSLGLSASYGLGSFLQPRQARANLDAAEADVVASAQQTRANVTRQYLAVLQAQATSALQDTLVAGALTQLELDRARQQVGAATLVEVRQSEVQVARQQVAQLQARNNVEIQMLTLFQLMGVPRPEGVRLVTQFPLSEPTFTLDDVLALARQSSPSLNAARARESSANVGVAVARSQWLPRVSFSTGWSGFQRRQTDLTPTIAQATASGIAGRRNCLTTDSLRVGAGLAPIGNCDRFLLTDADIAALRAENDRYPFDFDKDPFGYQISISLPLFNGFQREQSIQEAQLSRNDAQYARRAQELQLVTDVTTAYRNLLLAYQTTQMQMQAEQAARDALDLVQERYRVGAATYVEVANARSTYEQAATDRINSVYSFHDTFAQLEAAVGRPLR